MGLGLSPNLEASAWIARKLLAYSTGYSNGGWASGPDPLPLGVGAPGGEPMASCTLWVPHLSSFLAGTWGNLRPVGLSDLSLRQHLGWGQEA